MKQQLYLIQDHNLIIDCLEMVVCNLGYSEYQYLKPVNCDEDFYEIIPLRKEKENITWGLTKSFFDKITDENGEKAQGHLLKPNTSYIVIKGDKKWRVYTDENAEFKCRNYYERKGEN